MFTQIAVAYGSGFAYAVRLSFMTSYTYRHKTNKTKQNNTKKGKANKKLIAHTYLTAGAGAPTERRLCREPTDPCRIQLYGGVFQQYAMVAFAFI